MQKASVDPFTRFDGAENRFVNPADKTVKRQPKDPRRRRLKNRHSLSLFIAAAVFVLFPAAARARIVAADFRAAANHGYRTVAGLSRGNRLPAAELRKIAVGSAEVGDRFFGGSLSVFGADAYFNDALRHVVFDAENQFVEDVKSFEFILKQRIFLSVSAEVDGIAQRFKFFEVVLPRLIDFIEVNGADKAVQRRFTDKCLFAADILLNHFHDGADNLRLFHFSVIEVPALHIEMESGHHIVAKAGKSGGFSVGRSEHFGGALFNQLSCRCNNPRGEVIVCQDFVTLTVNDLSLFVKNIVIFKQMFTDFVVTVFNLVLRPFNGTGDEPVFDRLPKSRIKSSSSER